jgi:hypothetical protein
LNDRRVTVSKIRRTELLARLTRLEQTITEQAARAKFIRQKGWDARSADEHLKLLVDSHELYLSALTHLLGEDFDNCQASDDTTYPLRQPL